MCPQRLARPWFLDKGKITVVLGKMGVKTFHYNKINVFTPIVLSQALKLGFVSKCKTTSKMLLYFRYIDKKCTNIKLDERCNIY